MIKGNSSRCSRVLSNASVWRLVLMRRILPTSYSKRAGTCTSMEWFSTSLRRSRASVRRFSPRLLNHLTRTEESMTIFSAIPGIPEVSDDVGRIPLSYPVVFKLTQGGKRILPRRARTDRTLEKNAQGLADHFTSRPVLDFAYPVYPFEKFVWQGDHDLGHKNSPPNETLSYHLGKGNTFYILCG